MLSYYSGLNHKGAKAEHALGHSLTWFLFKGLGCCDQKRHDFLKPLYNLQSMFLWDECLAILFVMLTRDSRG